MRYGNSGKNIFMRDYKVYEERPSLIHKIGEIVVNLTGALGFIMCLLLIARWG